MSATKFFDNLDLPFFACLSSAAETAPLGQRNLDTNACHNYTWGMRSTLHAVRLHMSGQFSEGIPT
jgi:hypothetical protein